MGYSREVRAYRDIERQLNEAREMGGALISFATKAEATTWKARCYNFRTALRRQLTAEKNIPNYIAPTEWDDLHITRPDDLTLKLVFESKGVGTLAPLPEDERPTAGLVQLDDEEESAEAVLARATKMLRDG